MRAEEIIAEIYRQKKERLQSGSKPARVVLPMSYYSLLEAYRSRLGVLEGPVPDYLQKDSVFGLHICIDDRDDIGVL